MEMFFFIKILQSKVNIIKPKWKRSCKNTYFLVIYLFYLNWYIGRQLHWIWILFYFYNEPDYTQF